MVYEEMIIGSNKNFDAVSEEKYKESFLLQRYELLLGEFQKQLS
jgi:hypothetical protein